MKFNNVGPISNGEITLSDMTIFFGKNGMGKTYASYVLFGILSFLLEETPDFIKEVHLNELVKNKEIIMNFDSTVSDMRKELVEKVQSDIPYILSSSFNRNKNSSIREMEVVFTEQDFDNMNYFVDKTEITYSDYSEIVESQFLYKLVGVEGFSEDKLYNILLNYNNASNNITIKISENNYKSNTSVIGKKELEPLVFQGINRLRIHLNRMITKILKNPGKAIYIPAERIGINVFRNEIKNNRLN
uniref:hypothetical protein n=1 Tax=Lactococcus garvieae TaxID=1363 RepID=UPI00254CB32C